MAYAAQGSFPESATLSVGKTFDYKYPLELNLKPGSALHSKLVGEILSRARDSRDKMSGKYETWRKIDRNLTGYVPLDSDEKAVKSADDRKPTSLVIPQTFAIRETLLTYLVGTFLKDVYFPYGGLGPEDTVGAILLSHVVQQQVLRDKIELALHTQWSDSITYGIGLASVAWQQVRGNKVRWVDSGMPSVGKIRTMDKDKLLWEGCMVRNIDPYMYLPEPNTPIQRMQDSEFVGFGAVENRMNLLSRENAGFENLFNVQYLPQFKGHSIISMEYANGREERTGGNPYSRQLNEASTNPVDVIWMYWNLIPAEVGLGDSRQPSKWIFGLANDRLIIKATPLDLNHTLYPITACAPDFDGYTTAPTSRLEVLWPLQELIDWMISSHVTNVRKTINNTYVIDPFKINEKSVRQSFSKAGGYITLRRNAWGQSVNDAIMQLKTEDVTRGNTEDATYLTQIMERVSSATGASQGMFDANAPERRTADEFNQTQSNATARLTKMARMIHVMSIRDLGHMLAAHTIQFMEKNTFTRLTGEYQERLIEEYGYSPEDIINGRIAVHPADLDIDFDIEPLTVDTPNESDPQLLVQLYQAVMGNPLLAERFDLVRMFKSLARRMGEPNISEFAFEVKSDEEVQNRAADGELRPVREA